MKTLLVHNYYGSSAPSGENKVFEAECALLREHGHEVETFTRHSDSIRVQGLWGSLKGAFALPWNQWMFNAIRKKVNSFKPDIVHVHNTFPLISPAIFYAIGTKSAKVLTLHNYRIFCPAAIPLRKGLVCTECLDNQTVKSAIRYGCYRGSRLATIPLVLNVALHRNIGTWEKYLDAFITLSEFQRKIMIDAGLPAGRVYVKPNFCSGPSRTIPWSEKKPYVVFVGRLSVEKGVESLIKAWLLWGTDAPELRIIGDGPLRGELERLIVANHSNLVINFLGRLEEEDTLEQISYASLLVLPSEWYETFGLVLLEAAAFGTPAAVSNIGPLPDIVKNHLSGVVFEPANPRALYSAIRDVWEDPKKLESYGKRARAGYEEKYTQEANYSYLMGIYQKVLSNRQN